MDLFPFKEILMPKKQSFGQKLTSEGQRIRALLSGDLTLTDIDLPGLQSHREERAGQEDTHSQEIQESTRITSH